MSTDEDPASAVYGGMVADLIDATSRASTYQPARPLELFIRDHRQPRSIAELAPLEQQQLERIFRGDSVERALAENVSVDDDDVPLDVEVAVVVDDAGTPRYRLYGMNYGVVYLMDADRLACVAFAAQHDLEHWHADQRPIFWAMDRALRRGGHGFQQPMKFCWWKDACWDEIAHLPRGQVQSEPYIRQQFAGATTVDG